jgi:hypothetical protein
VLDSVAYERGNLIFPGDYGLSGFRSFRQASIREGKLAVFSVSLVEKEKTNVPRESFLLVPAGQFQ